MLEDTETGTLAYDNVSLSEDDSCNAMDLIFITVNAFEKPNPDMSSTIPVPISLPPVNISPPSVIPSVLENVDNAQDEEFIAEVMIEDPDKFVAEFT